MDIMRNSKGKAVLLALAAALFYSLSTPFSKLLLDKVGSGCMAAFLYLGAGAGVGIMYLFRYKKESASERLTRADLPYTLGMIVLDIAAPLLLMAGLSTSPASGASLLGSFEIVATTLIAMVIFREKVTKTLWTAICFITLATIALSFEGGGSLRFSAGSLLVILATCCWGLENNCTRRISGKSTYEIVVLKGIFSGLGALLVALLAGEHLPALPYMAAAMLLGFTAYGLSIFVYIRAQRELGAAKTSAYYAVAPFIGTLLSFILTGESLTGAYFIGLILMTAGTVFVVKDTMKGGSAAD